MDQEVCSHFVDEDTSFSLVAFNEFIHTWNGSSQLLVLSYAVLASLPYLYRCAATFFYSFLESFCIVFCFYYVLSPARHLGQPTPEELAT